MIKANHHFICPTFSEQFNHALNASRKAGKPAWFVRNGLCVIVGRESTKANVWRRYVARIEKRYN